MAADQIHYTFDNLKRTRNEADKWRQNYITGILPRHRNIMRLQLKNFPLVEIAEMLNMTPQAVGVVVNSDVYKVEFEKLQNMADEKCVDGIVDARRKLEALSGKSIAEIERILASNIRNEDLKREKFRADLAFDILDRVGVSKPKETNLNVVVDYAEAAVRAYERRKLAKRERAMLADVPAAQKLIELEAQEGGGVARARQSAELPENDTPEPELLAEESIEAKLAVEALLD